VLVSARLFFEQFAFSSLARNRQSPAAVFTRAKKYSLADDLPETQVFLPQDPNQ
jgi:hypothetical protein